jgi:hypothetical protein
MPVLTAAIAVLVAVAIVIAWRRHRRAKALAGLTPEERAAIVAASLSRARAKQRSPR